MKTLRIATRQSPLALWQANHVRELLLKQWPGLTVDLVPMVTSGDKFLKDKLLLKGGKGLFVKELEQALLTQKADIAVHSTKDVPAKLPAGLTLAVICKRDNPFDALISRKYQSLQDLPERAVIGTASLRRQAQLLAYRTDFQIKTLRGNINTRLARLESTEYDAIILAAAGLERIRKGELITEVLSDDLMLPTCGQGALCIECREEDVTIHQLIAPLNDDLSAVCVTTERAVNAQLGGNCHVPLAVFCTPFRKGLHLRAKVLSLDGTKALYAEYTGALSEAPTLAQNCTQDLISQGALRLLGFTPHE